MRKTRILIMPGHTPGRPGAVNKGLGLKEHDVCHVICRYLIKHLKEAGCEHIIASGMTIAEKIKLMQIYLGPRDLAVEIHLNSYEKGSANGCEVLTASIDHHAIYHIEAYESQKIANHILEELEALGLRNRGVKIGYYRLNPANKVIPILRQARCRAIVLECFFLSNDEETKKWTGWGTYEPPNIPGHGLEEIAESIYKGIVKCLA